jgi:NAD(P)-dependent dehydrogenase (short-subunit alcohol dehydrogenase family)
VCGRDEGRIEAVRAAPWAAGVPDSVLAVAADVTRPDDLERFADAVRAAWGRVDGLVNNAGAARAGPFGEASDADWQADIDLKLLAAVRLTRALLPDLRASGAPGGPAGAGVTPGAGASVLNVLSVTAKAPPARSVPTSVTRAAGLALTKALASELGGDGVRVNALCVGLVESGQWRRRAEARGVPLATMLDELAGSADVPLGRVGRLGEFADLAAYLLSPRSSYVTGTAINLDGGMSPVP